MGSVTISRREYEELKSMARVDEVLVAKVKKALEDIKHGRITEWKPK